MLASSSVRAALGLAVAVAAGALLSGCSGQPPQNLHQKLLEEGVPPDSVPPGGARPDGTLNNGLLPEPWNDTS